MTYPCAGAHLTRDNVPFFRPVWRSRMKCASVVGARRWGALLGGMMMAVCLVAPAFAGAVNVQVTGRVAQPGPQTLPDGARLSDAVLKADVLPDAYPLGAAWLRASLRKTQTRWKAGLMYDVTLLRGQARLDGDTALTALASRLEKHWRALPVTGRQRGTLLDPRPLEISDRNHLLASGDRIIYPTRPDTVRVVGAVQKPCTLPLVPMQAARDYLPACTPAPAADKDWLYIIQPDGNVTRQAIALWNRHGTQPLAPGAILYVPVAPKLVPAPVRDSFNHDAARFLSTQVLSDTTRVRP